MLSGLYREILSAIEARDYDVFAGRVSLSGAAKLALMGQRSARGPALTPHRTWWSAGAASPGVAAAVEAAGRGAPGSRSSSGGPSWAGEPTASRTPTAGARWTTASTSSWVLHGLHRPAAGCWARSTRPPSSRASTCWCATARGGSAHLRAGRLPAPFHLSASFAAYPCVALTERAAALRALVALIALRPAARERLDDRTFAEWLRGHGPGPEDAIARFWDLIVLPTCNDRCERVSAALAAFVFQEGFLRTN